MPDPLIHTIEELDYVNGGGSQVIFTLSKAA